MSRARTSIKWDVYQVKTTILRCIFAFDIEICFLDSPTVCRCYVFLWGLKAILKFERRTIQQEEASFSYYYYGNGNGREREREREMFFSRCFFV